MKFKLLPLGQALVLAIAASSMTARADTLPSGHPPVVAAAEAAEQLPGYALTPDILYQFLLAEIAGQRGQYNVAAELLLKLAKRTSDPRIAQRGVEAALQVRDPALALEMAGLWEELAPASLAAKQTMGALLLNEGKPDQALPHFKRLFATQGTAPSRAFLQLAGMLSRATDQVSALKLMRGLAQDYSDLPEARYAVAQTAFNAGEFQLAQDETQEALRLKSGWAPAATLRGAALQRISPSAALNFYRDFIKQHPGVVEVRLDYARLLVVQKELAEARIEFKQIANVAPQNADVAVAVGLLSVQLNDTAVAEASLKKALELNHRDPDMIRIYLGQLYEESKRYPEALAVYDEITAPEQQIPAQIRSAMVLFKRDGLDAGRKRLQTINAETEGQRIQLVQADAQILREAKAYQQAFDVLSEALKKSPDNTDLLYDRAMVAEKLDRIDMLEQDLTKVIRLKPDSAHAYNALGYSLADRSQRLPEALQLVEKAHKLSPEDPFILDSLGWVQYRLGNLELGLMHLRNAYATRPDPEIAAHLGEVLWKQGKQQEAQKLWGAALVEHPANEVLLQAIQKFKP